MSISLAEAITKCEGLIKKEYTVTPAFWIQIKEAINKFGLLENFPKMEKAQSSNVDRIGYDSVNKTAYVLFLNKSMYMYFGVSETEFQNMKNAESVGSYFCRNFRNKYESRKCTKTGIMGF